MRPNSPAKRLKVRELGPSLLLSLCCSWLRHWSVPGWEARSCCRSLWIHFSKVCYPSSAWKKRKERAYIHDMWHLKPALRLKYNYGKTIHDYTIYHISLAVASVWSGLAKGSRSYLGSSPSSESESAALLELSQVSVMSQVLLVAWLWEDCDPPNLETYEICTEYKTLTIILKQNNDNKKDIESIFIQSHVVTCSGTWLVLHS